MPWMQKNKRIPFSRLSIRLLTHLFAWVGVSVWVAPASALGLGDGTTSAELGRPLDFRAVVRLAAGEGLDPDCVRAEVVVGERLIAPQGVGKVVTTGPNDTAILRVRTRARIDEPIVTVDVEVGCGQRVGRRYTVFADPPAVDVPVAPLAVPEAKPQPAPAAAPARALLARPRPVEAAPTARAAAGASAAAPRPRARPAQPPRRAATAPASAPRPAARLRLDAPAAPGAPVKPITPPAQEPTAEALALVDQANEAVKAAIAAASASQGRIAALENSVRELSASATEQRALIELLSARARQAESGSRWLWPLLLALLALAALAGWLWLRLREIERERQQAWLAVARGAQPGSAAATMAPGQADAAPSMSPSAWPSPSQVPWQVPSQVPAPVESRPRGGAGSVSAGLASVLQPGSPGPADALRALSPAHEEAAPTVQTQPLVGAAPPRELPQRGEQARDVSAEELIDLEQQAEFFVVLGQDDAAVDLLVAHLRDTGGASPLPYLKLLDIYQRRGDRDAYDRTRDRFNQRFNAHAPAWDSANGDGRGLEDYPAVVALVQKVWPQPLDAMAELESLVFRRSGGDLFDLPAYRELLLLYALARDLLETQDGGGAGVDVLLPLNDGPSAEEAAMGTAEPAGDAPPREPQSAPRPDLDLGAGAQAPGDRPR